MANTSSSRIDLTRGTGPQGHRARMRTRVETNGAETLADYELLEMLLFLGIPRKDTKPLAKGLISHFGSLINVFRAPTRDLRNAGLNDDTIRALRLPSVAAERLASAEHRERPVLGNWPQLTEYLETALKSAVAGQLRVLYLDNRNRLLADEAAPPEEDITFLNRAIAIRALALHATAIIGVHVQPALKAPALSTAARTLENALRPLSIVLHDVLISTKTATLSSLRQECLL
ncbi:RadC family protein [Gluconobacter japonicus]|uniref:JAB domain-containing protein n=1 Tax=Gluconobacter japonicus TaxID=376620 RepID=UPI001B8D8A32|nr:RadC family protein [Gluconobacter japonicus]MBS1050956.1 RadC family protein [Gluconobacter japonicus]